MRTLQIRGPSTLLEQRSSDVPRSPLTALPVLAATAAISAAQLWWRGDEHPSPFAESALLLCRAVRLGTIASRWYLAAVVGGPLDVRGSAPPRARGVRAAWGAVAAGVGTIVLVSQHHMHGGALAVGLRLAVPVRRRACHVPTEAPVAGREELGWER